MQPHSTKKKHEREREQGELEHEHDWTYEQGLTFVGTFMTRRHFFRGMMSRLLLLFSPYCLSFEGVQVLADVLFAHIWYFMRGFRFLETFQ